MIGKHILAFLLMRRKIFDWSLGSENKFTTTMKIQAPHPTDKKMVVALLKKQMYDHNENPSPPPPPPPPPPPHR